MQLLVCTPLAFEKIQHPLMIKEKNLQETRQERKLPQHNKGQI